MSKRRRGLSLDEKRKVMLSIMREEKQVYKLQELEKMGAKKGVVSQTVKDVLQSLVDDDMVDLEKIGSANFYWSFPSKSYKKMENKIEVLTQQAKSDEEALQALQEEENALLERRQQTPERAEKLAKLEEMKAKLASLRAEIARHRDNDPEVIKELEDKVKTAKEATNRWIDNIFQLKDYLAKNHGVDNKQFFQAMELPEDLDYFE